MNGNRPHVALEVVVPVYNEERALPTSIEQLTAALQRDFGDRWSVLIANNGSIDGTLQVAEELAARYTGRVHVLHLTEKGRGRALRAAWMGSNADVVVYTDVDLSTNLRHLAPLVEPLLAGRLHVATGSRLMRGADVQRQWKREVISRVYNLLVKAFFPRRRVVDTQCGFKALTRAAVHDLVPLVADQSWFFDTELLLRAEQRGHTVHQIPVHWVEDLDSRVRIMRTAIDNVKGLIRMRRTPLRTLADAPASAKAA